MSEVQLDVPGRSVALANKLLHSLTEDDLRSAGFNQKDIDDFGDFFVEVRYHAENTEACQIEESPDNE
ncbi:hypothetical protein ACR0ST_04210 [Aliidiomarina sp. Khilg15.8]